MFDAKIWITGTQNFYPKSISQKLVVSPQFGRFNKYIFKTLSFVNVRGKIGSDFMHI